MLFAWIHGGIRRVITPQWMTNKRFLSTHTGEEVLFDTSKRSIFNYKVIGAMTYAQLITSILIVHKEMNSEKESKYPLGVRLLAGAGLFTYTISAIVAFAFFTRKNILKLTYLNENLKITHMTRFLTLSEKNIPLKMISPWLKQGKNLKLSVKDARFGDQLVHFYYMDRNGKYINRKFLEDIAKGFHKSTEVGKETNVIFKEPPSIKGFDKK